MHESDADIWFQAFDCPSVPLAENTPAGARPPERVREVLGQAQTESCDGELLTFDCPGIELQPHTPATPRPLHRPAGAFDPQAAFAEQVANQVLDYARSHPGGLTAEQLAALVQQLVTKRSA